MNLDQQVCSLELAKRLKELDVKQESHFYWSYGNVCGWYIKCNSSPLQEDYSAFTVAELGEMLPRIIDNEVSSSCAKDYARLEFIKGIEPLTDKQKWMLAYVIYNDLPPKVCIIGDTEANVRAKMLIYLIENKFYEPK